MYRTPPTGAANRLWPLFSHPSTIRLPAAAPGELADRLPTFFADILGVTSKCPPETTRPVKVVVSWIFSLAPSGAGASADPNSPLSVQVPVTLSPTAAFVPSRDLSEEDGLCRRLSVFIERWLAERAESGGELRFEIAVYDNLYAAGEAGMPLLQLGDIRIPIDLGGRI